MAEQEVETTARGDARTVFISYASQDAPTANAVVGALERAGITCWIAPRDVIPGALYASEIVRGINECRIVVLVLSANSAASAHVGKELERASSKNRRIIALRTDATPLPNAFEYFLSESQWIEVAEGGIAPAAAKLAEAIRRHTGTAPAAYPDITKLANATPDRSRAQRRRAVILEAAAVLAVAIGAAAAWTLWFGKPAVTRQTPAVTTTARASVAVMPFANITGDASKDYLGDGMAEELINALAKVPGLTVPSRTSSFAYKGRNTDLKQIAKDLNVGTILEGSVRIAGETIRVTAQLIDAQTDRHLWSQTYDRKYADLFKLQDDLAHEIVTAFKTTMNADLPDFQSQVSPTQDVEAYGMFLQALALVSQNSDSANQKAIALLQAAVGRDPAFARAYLELAIARGFAGAPLADVERDARKAVELHPSLADTAQTAVFSGVAAKRRNWIAAEEIFRALPSESSDPLFYNNYVLSVLWPTGQMRKMTQRMETYLRLAPASPAAALLVGMAASANGRDADALRYANLAVALGVDATGRRVQQLFADIAARTGRYDEAARRTTSALSAGAKSVGAETTVRLVYAAFGDPSKRSAANASLRAMTARLQPRDWVVKAWGMGWHTGLGDLDAAFALAEQLRAQFTEQGPTNAWSWLWSPELRAFREDPRFQPFTAHLGLMKFWETYGPPDACELQSGKLTCH
jgi:TolB-like protein